MQAARHSSTDHRLQVRAERARHSRPATGPHREQSQTSEPLHFKTVAFERFAVPGGALVFEVAWLQIADAMTITASGEDAD
jgi:hypothetical protein